MEGVEVYLYQGRNFQGILAEEGVLRSDKHVAVQAIFNNCYVLVEALELNEGP